MTQEDASELDLSSTLAAAPRAVTPAVQWRAWNEPRVRAWLAAAAVLLILGTWFIVDALRAQSHQSWLIHHGVLTQAYVVEADNETVKNRPQRPDSIVRLEFTWEGQTYHPNPRPLEGREAIITTGETLPIHVNPHNPADWTWRETPQPLAHRIIGAMVSFPLAVMSIVMAVVFHKRTLTAWKNCRAIEATIVDMHITAIAPRARTARVAPTNCGDPRIYTVYLPARDAGLAAGDSLCILRPSNKSPFAVAASWFEA